MPYKDPVVAKAKAHERKRLWRIRNRPANWQDTRGRHGNHARGLQHPRWNQGKIISDDGYVKVRVGREHPLADSNGYAYEHLIVWLSAGNPSPGVDELLHHKDENRQNNRIGNLEKKTRSKHGIDHHSSMTDEQVREARERYAAGEHQKVIAETFGVPHQRISKIVRGLVRVSAGGPLAPGDNRVRDLDGRYVGKRAANRLLDGVEHNGTPEVKV